MGDEEKDRVGEFARCPACSLPTLVVAIDAEGVDPGVCTSCGLDLGD